MTKKKKSLKEIADRILVICRNQSLTAEEIQRELKNVDLSDISDAINHLSKLRRLTFLEDNGVVSYREVPEELAKQYVTS